jgi:hypothetical protein
MIITRKNEFAYYDPEEKDGQQPGDIDASQEAPAAPLPDVPSDLKEEGTAEGADERLWYVIHCYSGYENKFAITWSSVLKPWA